MPIAKGLDAALGLIDYIYTELGTYIDNGSPHDVIHNDLIIDNIYTKIQNFYMEEDNATE